MFFAHYLNDNELSLCYLIFYNLCFLGTSVEQEESKVEGDPEIDKREHDRKRRKRYLKNVYL